MIGKRVLVADDDPTIRKSVGAILAERGCDVTMCSSGHETILIVQAIDVDNSGFDLIISDIKMPDRSGYDVFRAVREASPSTPVILMTGFGYDPHHSIVRASQEGLHSFLFKPFRAKQLVAEVKKAFAPSVASHG
jgi:DNA-binding NtrC family response regulator